MQQMENTSSSRARLLLTPAAIFFVSLILFTYGLQQQEIIGFDSRFYLFALEMWRHGISYFPTTYHRFYPDYPVTSTLFIYLFAQLLGNLDKYTAVLPSAIMASLTLVFTYLIGAARDRRLGWYAVLYLLMTFAFFKSARAIALDFYPTAITAACFYLIYTATLRHAPRRALWVFPLFLVGFVFRGPIGLVIPTGVVCIYYLINHEFKKFFITGFFSFTLLLIATILLLLFAYHMGDQDFMQAVLRMQILGRMQDSSIPFYFYFVKSMSEYAPIFPFACLVMGGVFYQLKIKKNPLPDMKLLLMLCGWLLVILIGMSIPGDKKIRYILPLAPAAALLAAYPLITTTSEKYFLFLRACMWRLFLFMPLLGTLGIIALHYYSDQRVFHFPVEYTQLILFLLCLQLINYFIFYFNKYFLLMLIATMSMLSWQYAVIEPIEWSLNKARDFIQQIEVTRLEKNADLVFYRMQPDGFAIKYLINMSQEAQPFFVQNPEDLLTLPKPAFFVARAKQFAALPKNITRRMQIIAQDKVGHISLIVFQVKEKNSKSNGNINHQKEKA